jgi:multiple sugar transport system substrate-binding protein
MRDDGKTLRDELPENLIPVDRSMSRAHFLRIAGAGGLALTSVSYLAACGGDGGSAAGTTTAAGPPVQGATAAERAINGAKALNLPTGTTSGILFPSGTRAQIEPAAKEWEEATGIKINLIEQAQAQQLQRVSQEGVAKTGAWEIGVVLPKMLADMVSSGSIEDLSGWIERYNPEIDSGDDAVIKPLADAVKIGGQTYAMPNDGDAVVSFGRADLINDPTNQAAFEDEHGYQLAAPKTWKEYEDIARFLHAPDKGIYGAIELRDVFYGYTNFQCRWCSKALPFAFWFDDEMEPLVNSPEAIAAGEEYVGLKDVMHPDILRFGFAETYGGWAAGRAALGLGWPSQIKTANVPELSKIVGKQLNFRLPGSDVDGQINYRDYQSFGNSYTINKYAKNNKEAAYLFSQYLIDPEVSARLLLENGFFDPFRKNHMTDTGVARLYTEEQMGAQGPLALNMDNMAPDIILKGSSQYTDALARNLSTAFAGQNSIEQALNATADAWNRITDQQGRDEQIEAWQNLKQAYPA